jgi:hypothetical protein
MMGSQRAGQVPLFYAFNLEDHIPSDHLLRGIDRFMDLREPAWGWKIAFLTTRPSRRTDTADSARATHSATSLSRCCERCMGEGLVGGEGFAIDASVIKADANRAKGVPGNQAHNWNQGEGPSRRRCSHPSIPAAASPACAYYLPQIAAWSPPARVAGIYEVRAFSHSLGRKRPFGSDGRLATMFDYR